MNNYEKHIGILLVAISFLTISGCGSIIYSRYYKPSLPDTSNLPSKEWANGLAVEIGDICVWTRENQASNYNQLISEGPLGLPIVPDTFSSVHSPKRSPITGFEIWITVDKDYAGYAIDPKKVTLLYSDGTESPPEPVEIRRFKTKWEKPYFYILTANDVEHLDQAESVNFNSNTGPVDLWNWTRVNIIFSRQSTTSIPIKLIIHGLMKNGTEVEVPTFQLSDIETRTYKVAGIPGSPADPCRELFNAHNAH